MRPGMTELLKVYWMILGFMMMYFPHLIFYRYTETEMVIYRLFQPLIFLP